MAVVVVVDTLLYMYIYNIYRMRAALKFVTFHYVESLAASYFLLYRPVSDLFALLNWFNSFRPMFSFCHLCLCPCANFWFGRVNDTEFATCSIIFFIFLNDELFVCLAFYLFGLR